MKEKIIKENPYLLREIQSEEIILIFYIYDIYALKKVYPDMSKFSYTQFLTRSSIIANKDTFMKNLTDKIPQSFLNNAFENSFKEILGFDPDYGCLVIRIRRHVQLSDSHHEPSQNSVFHYSTAKRIDSQPANESRKVRIIVSGETKRRYLSVLPFVYSPFSSAWRITVPMPWAMRTNPRSFGWMWSMVQLYRYSSAKKDMPSI